MEKKRLALKKLLEAVEKEIIRKPDRKALDRLSLFVGFQDWESVLAVIGHGGLKEGQVMNKLMELRRQDQQKKLTDQDILQAAADREQVREYGKKHGGIVVQGIHDVAVRFSKCCSPLPGDEIVGFVTRGRGVTIHRTDCINVMNLPESERDRLLEAEWAPEQQEGSSYTVSEIIYANNRTGLLVDISKIFSERRIDLTAMNVRTSKHGMATIDMKFDVRSREQLRELNEKIRQVESVLEVRRSMG